MTFPPQPLSLITEFCGGGALDHHIAENNPTLRQRVSYIEGIGETQ